MKNKHCVIWFDYNTRAYEYCESGDIMKVGFWGKSRYDILLKDFINGKKDVVYGIDNKFPIIKYFETMDEAHVFVGIIGWRKMQVLKEEDIAMSVMMFN